MKLQHIFVEKLFGYLTYNIPAHGTLQELTLLYGENGTGKTSLLRLVYCILSSTGSKGYKSLVSKYAFREIRLEFDCATVIASRPEAVDGSFEICIRTNNETTESRYELLAAEPGRVTREENPATEALHKHLEQLNYKVLLLPDNRRISGLADFLSSPISQRLLGRRTQTSRSIRQQPEADFLSHDQIDLYHPADLEPILLALLGLSRDKTIRAGYIGSQSADGIYLHLIKRLSKTWNTGASANLTKAELIKRINTLNQTTKTYEKFGLIKQSLPDFAKTITDIEPTNEILSIVALYLDVIEARLEALSEVRQSLSTLEETANHFLNHKSLSIGIDKIEISNSEGTQITPDMLSSGERQMLYLLAITTLASDSTGLFIIDEPELSLNIRWQREIVSAMLQCANNKNLQFLLATHSFEILAAHQESVTSLTDQ